GAAAADRRGPRRQPGPGRGLSGRQGGSARLLRRPSDEGDRGQGEPEGRQRAAEREVEGLMHARVTRLRYARPSHGMLFASGFIPAAEQLMVLSSEDGTRRVWIELFGHEGGATHANRLEHQGAEIESEEFFDVIGELTWTDWARERLLDPERTMVRRRLAAALAKRLEPSLPAEWSGGPLVFYIDDYLRSFFDEPSSSIEEAAMFGVGSAVHQLPDDVSEDTRDPWPRGREGDGPIAGGETEVEDRSLHIWFGDKDDPVLALDPIPFDEIGL